MKSTSCVVITKAPNLKFIFTMIIFILINIVIPSVLCGTCETPVVCSGGSFTDQGEAAINCYFNTNINTTRHNFNVVHYPLLSDGDVSDSGTHVLLCNWGPFPNQLECKTEDGYKFNNDVSDRLTLHIPAVTKKEEGMYVCQLVPDDGIPVHTCQLQVQVPEKASGTDVTHYTSTSQNRQEEVVHDKHAADCPGTNNDGYIAGLVFLLVVVALLVGLLIIILRRSSTGIADIMPCVSCNGPTCCKQDPDRQILCRFFCIQINLPSFARRASTAATSPNISYRRVSQDTILKAASQEGNAHHETL